MENAFESQPRIFVVDDELEIAKMLTVIMQMNLFNAVAFSDPHAALEAAEASPPAYLISDIMMPGMNGVELAIRLKEKIPNCKILLFSGQIGAEDLIRDAGEAARGLVLIHKPIHPTKLVEAIKAL